MKKLSVFSIFTMLIFTQLSCDTKQLDGKWDDNIKLSAKELTVSSDINSTVITTEGRGWWIMDIGLNDNWNYDLSAIDTTQENFVIEEDAFTIERKNATEIHIAMTQNETGQERILVIGLQAGNYSDGIKITQTAD